MAAKNCSVCGAAFTWLARLGGDADDLVCKACEGEGVEKLEMIAGDARSASVFPDLVARFDSAAAEFRVPAASAAAIRVRLLENIFNAALQKERVSHTDMIELAGLVQKYQPYSGDVAGLRAAAGRLNRRVLIDTWNHTDPHRVECSGLMLQDGEVCRWEEPARLYEQRTRREYVGASHGVSFPLTRGIRYRVGAWKGTPIDTAYLSDCGQGTLHVTSERVCFTGSQQSAAVPWDKVINVAVYSDGFAIHRTGAKKPTVIQVCHTDLTLEILALVSPSKND